MLVAHGNPRGHAPQQRAPAHACVLCRYAVYVTGLPLDATQDEVLHHFNNLYRLDKDMTKVEPRFCRLCPLQQLSVRKKPEFPVKPVADTRNTGDDRYRGTWIAEVSIVHPVHDAVSGYLHLRKRVRRATTQCGAGPSRPQCTNRGSRVRATPGSTAAGSAGSSPKVRLRLQSD